MYHIALLDDDIHFLDCLYKEFTGYKNIEVVKYLNPYNLLEEIDQYDVVMIDYDMPYINAFQFFDLTKNSRYYKIIITKYDHVIYDSCRYQFFWFIRKRYLKEEFPEMMDNLLDTLEHDKKKFIISQYNVSISLYYDDILYIHTEKNYVIVHALKEYRVRSTFKTIVDLIDNDNFVIISYGVIVNIQHIKHIDFKNMNIYLDNNEVLTVSRKYKKKLKEKYKEYSLLW